MAKKLLLAIGWNACMPFVPTLIKSDSGYNFINTHFKLLNVALKKRGRENSNLSHPKPAGE
jgi:hypothetical protein